MRTRSKHIVSLVFVPLIVLLQFGLTNFVHYHKSENGVLIKHSHPYKTDTSHEHSAKEFVFLSQFDGAFTKSPVVLNIPPISFSYLVDVALNIACYIHVSSYVIDFLLRGPPLV